jgi:hypothetical protein
MFPPKNTSGEHPANSSLVLPSRHIIPESWERVKFFRLDPLFSTGYIIKEKRVGTCGS